ncbi:dermonecrotic toxin domain-containing protein [Pseudomonas azotoformans]
MPATSLTSTLPPALPGEQGQHYAFIRQAIPACLVQSSAKRRQALKQAAPQVPGWYDKASQAHKDQLNTLLQARCESLNLLEKTLQKIQSVNAFAQPLLEAALKDNGHDLDVNLTWLRLYSPTEDAFGVRTGGFKVRTFSLLQAALHNFEAQEAKPGYFNSASGFITEPDARGHFERHATTLGIDAFVKLCRELDLGAKYQAYLKSAVHPADVVSEGVLREQYIRHQQDAFAAAALMAQLKGDITESDYALLLRVLAGEQKIMLGDKQIWYRTPCLMNLHLQGCLVIEPCVEHRYSDWFIVYIPDDPEHPIKRYASFDEFSRALTARLQAGPQRDAERTEATPITDFQQFFSQFVAYKDRPYYFRRLTELVVDAPPQPFGSQWLRSEWGRLATTLVAPVLSPLTQVKTEPQPKVRVGVTDPNFNINMDSIKGLWVAVDLWPQRFESLRKRMLDNARAQAISTADADEAASARRVQHYLNMGLFGVNLLAMVIPPLGVVMSVVMAGQLLYEILEGAIELGEGDREAGWAHITDVVENLAMLAVGGAAFHFTVSPFIEGLKAVKLPSGKTRLWKPDLAPYEYARAIPEGALPNEHGVHQINGASVIALEDKRFKVRHEPVHDRYVIEHPSRADAYEPALAHNGTGAWYHELERPLSWEGARLMRRLGPVVDGFSDAVLEQIRHVSGVDEDVLRRLHVESEPVPAVLLDTIRQFRAYDSAMQVAQGIGAGALSDALCSYAAALAVELPGWPAGKAIEAFAGTQLSGASVKYGDVNAALVDTLQVRRTELMTGKLPERIVGFLTETQMDALVGRYTSRVTAARITALQKKMQDRAVLVRARLMRSLYTEQQPMTDAAVTLIQRDFKRLPTLMVREMLAEATPQERAALDSTGRIPLDLAQRARVLQQDVRLSLAYEGLYLDAMAGQDTEALVLNTLPALPGWADNLRLEVREGGTEGELRADFGPAHAEKKILVRVDEGRYQAFDDRGQQLHGINGLYGALQHALPDAQRNALGVPHVGQGEQLRTLILAKALPREALRVVLGMQPERLPFFRTPWRVSPQRLGYPLSGRGQGSWQRMIEERVRTLYPTMNAVQMREYLHGRNLEDDRWLKDLEKQYKQLESVLSRWLLDGPRDRATLATRRRLYDRLRNAWKKSGEWDLDTRGNYRGQRILLEDEALGAQLASLPELPGDFSHVSSVHMPGCGLTDQAMGLLAKFPQLRVLNLENNLLTRLPEACARMSRMEGLDLSDNQIMLTAQTVLHIRSMHQLEWLALQGNPLSMNIDIGRMPRLRWLYLSGCGLHAWPMGTFGVPRPRQFLLELTGNRLTAIPVVAPGSERARILARTAVTRDWLTPQVRDSLNLYLESVGLDPERRLPPRGTQDSAHWMSGLSQQQWLAKQETWNDLEEAIGSEPFFDEIRKLSERLEDRTDQYKNDLTAKVWRMLEAMAANTALRERLFEMAVAPTTCVDAGAQLFNAMGFEVLLNEARLIPNQDLVQLELLDLAKGKARLDELGRIAHARVSELVAEGRRFPEYDDEGGLIQQVDAAGRPQRSIDEVEIHLAYVTRLANELDLPWQTSMFYNEPDVTQDMLDDASRRVKDLETGDLLRDGIVEQPFWADFVQVTYANEFEAVSAKNEALINLYTAEQTLADDGTLSAQQKTELRLTIDTSAQVLGKSPEQVSPDRETRDEEFFADMVSLGEEHKNVLRTVTDRLMGRPTQNRK